MATSISQILSLSISSDFLLNPQFHSTSPLPLMLSILLSTFSQLVTSKNLLSLILGKECKSRQRIASPSFHSLPFQFAESSSFRISPHYPENMRNHGESYFMVWWTRLNIFTKLSSILVPPSIHISPFQTLPSTCIFMVPAISVLSKFRSNSFKSKEWCRRYNAAASETSWWKGSNIVFDDVSFLLLNHTINSFNMASGKSWEVERAVNLESLPGTLVPTSASAGTSEIDPPLFHLLLPPRRTGTN